MSLTQIKDVVEIVLHLGGIGLMPFIGYAFVVMIRELRREQRLREQEQRDEPWRFSTGD
jgi:hypothetical protein